MVIVFRAVNPDTGPRRDSGVRMDVEDIALDGSGRVMEDGDNVFMK